MTFTIPLSFQETRRHCEEAVACPWCGSDNARRIVSSNQTTEQAATKYAVSIVCFSCNRQQTKEDKPWQTIDFDLPPMPESFREFQDGVFTPPV